jgi:trehalose 6-phosphate phosphatase
LLQTEFSKADRATAVLSRVEGLVAARSPMALFLDIDGTLLDVALTPSTVHVPPGLAELLTSISTRLSGALAIVTGRSIAEADRLLQPWQSVAAGVHGAEMRVSASGPIRSLTPSFDPRLTADIKAAAESIPGTVFEDKGTGIALHYRLAPEVKEPLLETLETLVPKYPGQFMIVGGRKVFEILPIGFSKGRALRQLVALPEFANRVPLMIGDDIADVEAFRVAEDMGGYGLKVAGENFTAAEASFHGPAEVLRWLQVFRDNL